MLALASPRALVAQFTVGGIGADHPDIAQAVVAVPPDSILIVRPGYYEGFATSKPLRIRCVGSVTIQAPAGASHAIVVDGMHGTFALLGEGVLVESGTLGALRIANSPGRVFLSGVTVQSPAVALDVQNAGPVHLHESLCAGTPSLSANVASVTANGARFESPGGHGVVAHLSTMEFALGAISGTGLPAVQLIHSTLRLAGDGQTPIRVGGSSPWSVPAIDAQNSVLAWDPSRFTTASLNGAPALVAFGGSVVVEDPPAVAVRGGAPGTTGWIRLTSNVALPGLAVVAPYAAPFPIGAGCLWFDPNQSWIAAAVGIADAHGLFASFAMPTSPALLGDVSCVQGVVLAGSDLVFGGPAPLVTL